MRSFDSDPSVILEDPLGRRVHRRALEQSERLKRHFYSVRTGVWTLVGNGLSNQTFIEGPDGVIAIDTGESIEEMTSALTELRRCTQSPVEAFQQDMRRGVFRIDASLSQIMSILRPSTQKSLITFLASAGWMFGGAFARLALAYIFRAYLSASS